ncbi:MAG: kynureninase [Gammaproteobacteria bacterium]|jgi:kynureninase
MSSQAATLDATDPLAAYRDAFDLPPGLIYLDGNSLGALPKAARDAVSQTVEMEWGHDLIKSWNSHEWIKLPETVGEKIAPLLGAAAGQVICADSTSVNLFKLITAALQLRPGRNKIVSQVDNFPTDLYMAQGVVEWLGADRAQLVSASAEEMIDSIDRDTALVMLTHVNYRDGKVHDMARITQAAHEQGALMLWDLSHSTGAMPLALDGMGIDFAVGCGYKYLNGGPGAPAYVYVNRRLQDKVTQPLFGWMGHAEPFRFSSTYEPAEGVWRFVTGTPSVIAMQALSAALDMFSTIDLAQVRQKSETLTTWFIDCLADCPELELISPVRPVERGSQVSFHHPQGYAIVQALAAAGVIGDYRDPDILRFGFSPLYTSYAEAERAARLLRDILNAQTYLEPVFQVRQTVT